jgi:hypothetical protein
MRHPHTAFPCARCSAQGGGGLGWELFGWADCDALDFDVEALAGGSCSTGRGVVCACEEDASLERTGGDGGALDCGGDDARDESECSLTDELTFGSRLGALGEDAAQSDLPLEAVFGESLQWSP